MIPTQVVTPIHQVIPTQTVTQTQRVIPILIQRVTQDRTTTQIHQVIPTQTVIRIPTQNSDSDSDNDSDSASDSDSDSDSESGSNNNVVPPNSPKNGTNASNKMRLKIVKNHYQIQVLKMKRIRH